MGWVRRNRWLVIASAFALPGTAWAQQGAVGLNDTPERLQARSDVKGLAFTMLDRLPKPAPGGRGDHFCKHYAAKPASEAARAVQAQGWTVTGEAPLGPFVAVSFAGSFQAATSGTCFVQDGNVGIFRGGRLLAVAYEARGGTQSIGKVSPLEGGAVRVWSGEPLSLPLGDIQRESTGYLLRLGTVAPLETLCNGRATVPNIYGMGIDRARRALIQAGWTPVPGNAGDDNRFGVEKELRKKGIAEVDGCSGTGFGFCSFTYKGAAGTLAVTTAGEDEFPAVSGYSAQCS